MTNKRRIIGIVGAALLALVGTIALVGYVQSARDEAVAQEELVEIYVVDDFVPQGADPATIRSAVSVEAVPARLKQADAITDLDQLGERVAASDLQPGDQLVAARLVTKGAVSAEITDKVQVSALLEAERAVGGALQKGDLVGVYLSFEPFDVTEAGQDPIAAGTSADLEALAGSPAPESTGSQTAKTPNVSRLEFRNVLVTNVQTTNPPVTTDGGDDETTVEQVTGTQYVVTLALTPEQSERFVFATEFGSVTLSLDPATVADDGTRPVTLSNVFEVVR